MPRKKKTLSPEEQKWQKEEYNTYVPLASGYVAFRFRNKWFTQDIPGPLIHPKKDTKEEIKQAIMELEKFKAGGKPKDPTRHDKKTKEELISKLMEFLAPHEVKQLGYSSGGKQKIFPRKRIVYCPSNPPDINYYHSKLIGGDQAVPGNHHPTDQSCDPLPVQDIILTTNDEGKVIDEFNQQRPVNVDDLKAAKVPDHIGVPYPGRTSVVPITPVTMLPAREGKDPLITFLQEEVDKYNKWHTNSIPDLHPKSHVCASHWCKIPRKKGSIYYGACRNQTLSSSLNIFVRPAKTNYTCHVCNSMLHKQCVLKGDDNNDYCFGCINDEAKQKAYWLEALYNNQLQLSPPPTCS